jgi:agmatinase
MKLPLVQTTFISATSTLSESQAVILGCPFDGTASFRPGARFGPSAIRRASTGIETYSPYLKKDLTDFRIHDLGDLELPLGEKDLALNLIRQGTRQILTAKKFPIFLGGDHLITLPVLGEMFKAYPRLHLVHLDAHTDLREEYLGETFSHSTVMRKILETSPRGRLLQVGIRSGTKDEFEYAGRLKSMVPFNPRAIRMMVRRLKNKPVYITLDLDVFDPALIPGVGTPEPGGITFREFTALLSDLRNLHVVGFDLVELTPDYDPTQISAVTASVILREMILAFCHSL